MSIQVQALLQRAKALPADKQRRVAAIVGSIVADAAAQPIHWVYDDAALKAAVKDRDPEFLPQSVNPYYRQATGAQTFYGDQFIILLKSLVECKGLNVTEYAKATYKGIGPGSPFDQPKEKRQTYPFEGKWVEDQMQRFVECYEQGVRIKDLEDTIKEPYTLGAITPLVALYAGDPDLLKHAEESIRLIQNNPIVVSTTLSAARVIEQYILGAGQPLETVLKDLRSPDRRYPQPLDADAANYIADVMNNKPLSVFDATLKFGKACYLPGSFQSAVRSLLDDTEYVSAARKVMLAGGNNCIRLLVVGACLGAKYGLDAIPISWIEKTDAAKEILELSLALVEG